MSRPDLNKLPVHLHGEINLVKQDNIKKAFSKNDNLIDFLKSIPKEKWSHRYAKGKWSILELVQHVIDAERIICNRALVIARKDETTPLVSFEGDDYVTASNADNRTKEDLIS